MGFETLLNTIKENKEQTELDKQEEMNPTECPEDCWPLSVNDKGEKSCPICGRIWK